MFSFCCFFSSIELFFFLQAGNASTTEVPHPKMDKARGCYALPLMGMLMVVRRYSFHRHVYHSFHCTLPGSPHKDAVLSTKGLRNAFPQIGHELSDFCDTKGFALDFYWCSVCSIHCPNMKRCRWPMSR